MFKQPVSINRRNFGTGPKPKGALWFSSGSYFFDPYHTFDNEVHGPPKDTKTIEKCIMAEKPKKIKEINTFKDLDDFVNKYHLMKPDGSGPDYSGINWNKVYNDSLKEGFLGIAFNFCKVSHISDKYDVLKFGWHNGYDVESLLIFNTDALEGCLSDVCVNIDTLDIVSGDC
jgi:hypothetical protein